VFAANAAYLEEECRVTYENILSLLEQCWPRSVKVIEECLIS